MSKESKRFRVSPDVAWDIIEDADRHYDVFVYVKEVMQKVKERHPVFYRYLSEESEEQGEYWNIYSFASALSYEIVAGQLDVLGRSVDITPQDISRHKKSIDVVFDDPRWKNENWIIGRVTTREEASADSGLGLFLNTIDMVAPELGEEMGNIIIERLEDEVEMRHFIRGVFDGFMPLYRKVIQQAELR